MGNNLSWQNEIPYEVSAAYVKAMASNKPIISVGSGIGEFEKKMENELKQSIICIDPHPTSFNDVTEKKHMHLPDFAKVDDLIQQKPHLVGQCHLLLLWSTPNESCYDIEAVAKLNPIDIIVVYETLGGAAGRQMHIWLKSLGAPNADESSIPPNQHDYITDIQKSHAPYKLISVYENGTRSFTDQTFCLIFISKEKKENMKLPQRSYRSRPPPIQDDYNKIIIEKMFETINANNKI